MVRPPRDRPRTWSSGSVWMLPGGSFWRSPFCGRPRCADGTADGAVHAGLPGDQALRADLGLEPFQDPFARPVALPSPEQVVHPVPRAVALSHVPARVFRRGYAPVCRRSAAARSRSAAAPALPGAAAAAPAVTTAHPSGLHAPQRHCPAIRTETVAVLGSCGVQETRLDIARIRAARRVIDPIFLDSPLYRCEALEPGLGCTVSIKLETANPVRSFKARGTEVVTSLLADHGSRAVVCASAGNLGQALAWSGRARGLDVAVVASRFAPAAKLDRIRALGATLELVDGDFEMARARAAAVSRYDGIRLLEDSLDIETCEGAATIGLELVDGLPSVDAVLIALGGGALATGVGHVVKACAPEAEVICVQPLGAPAMTHSWRQRRVVTTDTTDTIADGVAGRRPIPAVLDDLLLVADDAVLVEEASIIAGMRLLFDHAGLVVEPSAALGIAAILEDRDRFAGRHVVTIVCGGNVDVGAYRRWVGGAPIPRS